VTIRTIEYQAAVKHDGRLYEFSIPELTIPVCDACGERVFTSDVDRQVNEALRSHLRLLSPSQIRGRIKEIGMSQKEVARCIGIAEETLSRWLNESQIQSRAMDILLRVFLADASLRATLSSGALDPTFGLQEHSLCENSP
jgi:DNA-binding transcriptional regulator YiaG